MIISGNLFLIDWIDLQIRFDLFSASLPRSSFLLSSITGNNAIELTPLFNTSSTSLRILSALNLDMFGIESICSVPSRFSLINNGCIKSLEDKLVSETNLIKLSLALRRLSLEFGKFLFTFIVFNL